MIGGQPVKYTSTTGTLPLMDDAGKVKANVFFIAYERSGQDRAKRPVTFAFNGGPGSSSVWLHLGALGPRRVLFGPDGETKPPPASLEDNESSWLDMTDLVFIDPVSTGYSRQAEGENANQFHGLNEDIASVGSFIRMYCGRYQRWDSPKFLVGESYGTTRAAGLSGYLQDQLGMYLNGIVLISTVLDFSTISFDAGNDTPYWLFLPSYTATAWFHKRLAPELQADLARTLAEARAFASGEYLAALARGDDLPAAESEAVAAKVARLTGLSREYVSRARLRVSMGGFAKELLRDRGRTVGRFDSRYTGMDRTGTGAGPDYDPSHAAIQGPFTTAFNSYVRRELGYESDRNYEVLTGNVQPWNFGGANNRYANVSETLRSAMTKNPSLRVMFCAGYYDLATPFFAAEYTGAHLGLEDSLRSHVVKHFYQAGHMMYLRQEDRAKLKADAEAFYRDAVGTR
jgi:carboxypeptidase C (cathepsin A)